jgi:hypothetical protein
MEHLYTNQLPEGRASGWADKIVLSSRNQPKQGDALNQPYPRQHEIEEVQFQLDHPILNLLPAGIRVGFQSFCGFTLKFESLHNLLGDLGPQLILQNLVGRYVGDSHMLLSSEFFLDNRQAFTYHIFNGMFFESMEIYEFLSKPV